MRSVVPVLFVLGLLGTVVPAGAQPMTDIQREVLVERAATVALWALPAVITYDIAASIERDLEARLNDVVYLSRPMTSRHGFLTANDVTPYAVSAMTVAEGPLVVEVPPASNTVSLFGTFVDAWMRPLADVGPTGDDEGRGAKYLFLPPGFQGDIPEGYLPYRLETHGVNFAFRPVARNGGTLADAAACAQRIRVYPLAQAAAPPPTRYIDAYPRDWNTLPTYDLTFFQDIWNVVQREPVLERDKSMMGLLATLGIEKGKPFRPSFQLQTVLVEGAERAFDYLQDRFLTPGYGLVPFYSEPSRWQTLNISREQAALGFPFATGDRVLVEERAINYFLVTYLPRKPGASSVYTVAIRDSGGELMNGTDTYRLRVPANVPARDFWSVVAYSLETKGFIADAERVGLSSRESGAMTRNEDGSVDLYFGPQPPQGLETNWIPTSDDFFLMFRFYGPEQPILDRTWVLPDVYRIR